MQFPNNKISVLTNRIMMALKKAGHIAADEPDQPHHYNRAFETVHQLIGEFAEENKMDMEVYPVGMEVIPEGRHLISDAISKSLQDTLSMAQARKGEEHGECNRFRCINKPATHKHKDNGHFYCRKCAAWINRENNEEICAVPTN